MKKILILSAVAFCLASCSPYVLRSSGTLNDSDMSQYKSFQLQEIEKESIPEQIMEPDVERLCYVIAKELEAKGYTQVESGADLTLYVGLSTSESIETDVEHPSVSGYVGVAPMPRVARARFNYIGATPYVNAYYGDPLITTEVVDNGLLVVDFVDNSDNNHVFYSQLSGEITGDQLIMRDNKKLEKAISTLLKKLPLQGAE